MSLNLPVMTRRSAMGTGLASFAMAAVHAPVRADAEYAARRVLIDSSVIAPLPIEQSLRALGIVASVNGVTLDAAGYAAFKHLLDAHQAIVGVTSAALLFCLGEIAADHGFRLIDRRPECATETAGNRCDVLTAAVQRTLGSPMMTRARNEALHVWTIRRTNRGPLGHIGQRA